MKLFFCLLFLCGGLSLHAKSRFIPERGDYAYSPEAMSSDILKAPYLFLSRSDLRPNDYFKKLPVSGEYQPKNWFEKDWYLLQEVFSLNEEEYVRFFGAKSFNEAKLTQYRSFDFIPKSYQHEKTVATLREWAGLTHPPLRRLTNSLEFYDHRFSPVQELNESFFDPAFQREIDEVSKSELSFGNELRPLADRDAFEVKKKMIEGAKENILLSTLAIDCDESGNEITSLLIKKHKEGIKIKVLVDALVNNTIVNFNCPRKLMMAGIDVISSRDFVKSKLKTLNHSKFLVIDFKEGIAGGQNVLDADLLSRGTDFMNRDVDLYVKGPLAVDMTEAFLKNWDHHFFTRKAYKRFPGITSGESLMKTLSELKKMQASAGERGVESYQKILNSEKRMRGVCRFINQTPYDNKRAIGKAYLKILDRTQNHLMITDPIKEDTETRGFFKKGLTDKFDSWKMFNELHVKIRSLMERGVDLDYITSYYYMAANEFFPMLNQRMRNQLKVNRIRAANISHKKLAWLTKKFAKSHYKNLLTDYVPFENTKVWLHVSFMHSKIFYFDRTLTSIGSYNFQHNATDHSYEVTSICLDENLNRELEEILVLDMANSVPLVFRNLK